MKRMHEMPFGAVPTTGGGARFRLWAPAAGDVELVCSGGGLEALHRAMQRLPEGWFECTLAQVGTRTDYAFRVDHATWWCPTRRRAAQPPTTPHGAEHGSSDPLGLRLAGSAAGRGRPWHEAVIYELHIGCFTAAGQLRVRQSTGSTISSRSASPRSS
jgi:maltooligosyltrehalose trehalohydrolase